MYYGECMCQSILISHATMPQVICAFLVLGVGISKAPPVPFRRNGVQHFHDQQKFVKFTKINAREKTPAIWYQ